LLSLLKLGFSSVLSSCSVSVISARCPTGCGGRGSVYIVGHTDSEGTPAHNLELSRHRAEAVAEDLVRDYKIARARLSTAGVGFLAPVGSNGTDSGRALNRRVELVQP
jgi:outer membrane protein OmpA-like peptidoglycan-associated protein